MGTEVSPIRRLFEYDETNRSVVIFKDNRKLADSPFNNRGYRTVNSMVVPLQACTHRKRRNIPSFNKKNGNR